MDWFIHAKPIEELEHVLQDLVVSLVSVHDPAKLPEAVFHAFVLGLLANLRFVYEIRSNAEAGYGRADIIMIPKTTRYPTAYVIEFKSISQKKDLKQTGMKGLAQIREREYPVAIHNAGVSPEQVRTMAIIMQEKRVMVMEEGQEGSSNTKE